MQYRLSDTFIQVAMSKFDPEKKGILRFDDFIRLCCVLQSMSKTFAAHDIQRQGRITVSYEEFLPMVFIQSIKKILPLFGVNLIFFANIFYGNDVEKKQAYSLRNPKPSSFDRKLFFLRKNIKSKSFSPKL